MERAEAVWRWARLVDAELTHEVRVLASLAGGAAGEAVPALGHDRGQLHRFRAWLDEQWVESLGGTGDDA